ncbi:MAG TPA: STAS domain-containing protein [Methanospirillum sp.]|nr:STAS domain-containing protein [Methanospirillum sp.]
MDIKIEICDDCLILAPSGRIDGYGSGLLQHILTTNLTDHIRHIIFDLKDAPYLSSAGIRVFLVARNRVKERSGRVMLCAAIEFIKNILAMAGMDQVFPIYPDREQALSALRNHREPPIPSSPMLPSRYQVGNANIEITKAGIGPSILQVSGSLTKVLHAGITPDDVERLRFSDCEYSLGLGALAENPEQARHLLGEMITLHHSIVWLPTDGNAIPDFFTPVRDTGGVEIYSGFAVALKGPFHEYLSLVTNSAEGILLSQIYQGIFSHARKNHPDFAGIVAITLIGTTGGVRCSGILQPPIPENAPPDGGSIMDPAHVKNWIEVTDTPQYAGETLVAFGVGIDLKSDLSRFDPDDLSALYYIHPANQGSQEMFLHTHGVIFGRTPLPRGKDVGREISHLVTTGEFLDMRHLMDDTRFLNARCAISYISEIHTESD